MAAYCTRGTCGGLSSGLAGQTLLDVWTVRAYWYIPWVPHKPARAHATRRTSSPLLRAACKTSSRSFPHRTRIEPCITITLRLLLLLRFGVVP